jgi:very-short-patch-repair endonuclease
MLGYVQRNAPLARGLRRRMTDAEQKLWRHLPNDQLGVRFYRQRPLGPYIVDFYSFQARLVIELDGSQHVDDPSIRKKDGLRDAWLRSRGLKILRFDDRQVLTETQSVMEVIFKVVEVARVGEIPPSPPLKRGEMPPRSIEGSLPFPKGGQEGFDDARQTDQVQD